MPEAMSCMHEAHCIRLTSMRLAIGSPALGCTSGGGGGTAMRQLAHRALCSRLSSSEVANGASNKCTYHLAPEVVARASGNSVQVEYVIVPNLMYSSLQQRKNQIKYTDSTFGRDSVGWVLHVGKP